VVLQVQVTVTLGPINLIWKIKILFFYAKAKKKSLC